MENKTAIVRYHRSRLELSGVRVLGWRDVRSQQVRFQALSDWGLLDGLEIADLGCGLGDLCSYLSGKASDFHYLGIDLLPEFVAEAYLRHGERSGTRFITGDFMEMDWPQVDVVFASGSLNYQTQHNNHPYAAIAHMWEHCRRGLAFNLLDARYHPCEGLLVSYEPQVILDYCRRFDRRAELVTGYHPEDFTILMRRAGPFAAKPSYASQRRWLAKPQRGDA